MRLRGQQFLLLLRVQFVPVLTRRLVRRAKNLDAGYQPPIFSAGGIDLKKDFSMFFLRHANDNRFYAHSDGDASVWLGGHRPAIAAANMDVRVDVALRNFYPNPVARGRVIRFGKDRLKRSLQVHDQRVMKIRKNSRVLKKRVHTRKWRRHDYPSGASSLIVAV